MDPLLVEYLAKVRETGVTANLVLILDGQVVAGLPVSDHKFVAKTNAVIDDLSQAPFESDDPKFSVESLKGLRFDPRDEDVQPERFVTLDNAAVLAGLTDIDMPTMRIDLNAVTGWAIAPYEPEESGEEDEVAEQPQPA